ncbi:MAG: redox-sensing transcriptional repressor Rex [Bacillota bacterium]|nr:redox-sensing transcriptional repressor Rex [Bacillota bacterium]
MKTFKIPEASIIRLSVYSRYLHQLDQKGVITISSGEIAEGVGVSPAQVRKDLAYFGEFGTRGVGYNVKELHGHIMKILGLNHKWPIVIVGAGNLGTALSMYKGFTERGFVVSGIFDNDESKIGTEIGGITIQPIANLTRVIRDQKVEIGVITVPANYCQEIANIMIEAGVNAILNFAPKVINVPPHIEVRNVDLSVNLEVLTFNLVMKRD